MKSLSEYADVYQIDEIARIGFLTKSTPCPYEIYVMTDDPGKDTRLKEQLKLLF